VDTVTDLLALVAVDLVFAALQVALDQVTEKAVQLYPRVVRPGQASPAQAAGGHIEIPAVFLHHHIARQLGGAEQGMFGLVDGEVFGNAVLVSQVGVIPAGLQFPKGNVVGPVAVDLVGRHVDKRRLRARPSGRFQHVERAHRVDLEVEKTEWPPPGHATAEPRCER